MTTTLTTGYPTTRFGILGSQGSAPAKPALSLDPYREALATSTEPPLDSPFAQASVKYKYLDDIAFAAGDKYKAQLKTAQDVTLNMRTRNPRVFKGQPLETQDWHRTTARFALRAAEAFKV